jgi:hypothetical protein
MLKAPEDFEFIPRFVAAPLEVQERIKALRRERDAALKAFQAERLALLLPTLPINQLASAIAELLEKAKLEFIAKNYGIQPVEHNFLLAASESGQTAADAHIEGTWQGAMTWGLSKAIIESNGELTYGQLIRRTAKNLAKYDQRPQLECPEHLRQVKVFAPLG